MSTVAEIQAVLPKLSNDELQQVERAVRREVLQRGDAIVYSDRYGDVTESDLIAAADEAFKQYDKEEGEGGATPAR